ITWTSDAAEFVTMGNPTEYTASNGTYTITTTDGTEVTTTDQINFTGYVSSSPSAFSGANWDMQGAGIAIPAVLKVCQVCGIEDVVVFCDECKNVMNWARKKWAEAAMKELEDDLS
ncbi:unnamed protein product, partial [marine sediment metagenome]